MRTPRLVIFLLFVCAIMAYGGGDVQHPTALQWSRRSIVKSPNREWQVEVHPILTAEENQSPVVIRNLKDDRTRPLFILRRSAELQWGPGSDRLLVIDQPTADDYNIALFTIDGARTTVDTDKVIRLAISQQLGAGRSMEFYLPRFVVWRGKEVVVSVGGSTSSGINRPMVSYCYGVLIDSDSGEVLRVFQAEELKARFRSECRVSP